MYSIGGCITITGSCSNGFKSRPSNAAGSKRKKGLELANNNPMKATCKIKSTAITRARKP